MNFCPRITNSPYPRSSAKMNTKFGLKSSSFVSHEEKMIKKKIVDNKWFIFIKLNIKKRLLNAYALNNLLNY